MNRSILVIVLCALQGACANIGSERPDRAPLLTYDDFRAEISVIRVPLDVQGYTPEPDGVIAAK